MKTDKKEEAKRRRKIASFLTDSKSPFTNPTGEDLDFMINVINLFVRTNNADHVSLDLRFHPETFERVEKPEEWASYSIKIGLNVETRDEIKFNQLWDEYNNALTLEQVFERYNDLEQELQRLREVRANDLRKAFDKGVYSERLFFEDHHDEEFDNFLTELLTTPKEG